MAGVIDYDYLANLIDPPSDTSWNPLPHQTPPTGNWFYWLLFGGRGSGKTHAASRYTYEHAMGPPCLPHVPGGHWMGLVAPTLGDAVTSGVEGPSGLRAWDPGLKLSNPSGGAQVTFSNGAQMKLFGAYKKEDVERFRSGGNRCMIWCEEMAAWRYLTEAWEQIRYGLRVGPRPHAVISTTPKSRKLIKTLIDRAASDPSYAKVSTGTTFDNPHLDERVKQALREDYEGTRMGRQELYAEYLEDNQNALWSWDDIEKGRFDFYDYPQQVDRIVVAVDPQAKEGGDNTGIIIGGVQNNYKKDTRAHGFVLGDYSINGSPEEWGRQVIRAFDDYQANEIVVEVNNGGDMIKHTLLTLRDNLPIKEVHASRGKAIRAEPVAALYQQHRIHHIGSYPELEEEMVSFDPIDPDPAWSPDRMDALVWAFSRLMVKTGTFGQSTVRDDRLRGRR